MKLNSKAVCSVVAVTLALTAFQSKLLAQEESSPPPGKDASIEPSPQEQLKSLSDELIAFRKTIPMEWMVKFPDPPLVQNQTKTTLRQLYGKLLAFYDENMEPTTGNEQLFAQWAYNFEGVYTHRIMLEWQDFDAAWGEFLDLDRKFSKIRIPRNPQAHQRFTASLADTNLRLWTGEHASVLMPWIEGFGKSVADEAGKLPAWWLRDRCDYGMFLTVDGTTCAQHPKGAEWLRAYLLAEDEPLEVRSFCLARRVTHLHTERSPDEALVLLNWWEKLHPDEFVSNVSIIHKSFFVHQIGLGKRDKARSLFHNLDLLISQGSLSAENDLYRMVTQNYYENLMRSDLDHQSHISALALARSSKNN